MLIDSHCHLDFSDFEGDRPEVIARAHGAGVGLMLTICTHLSKFPRVYALARRFDSVWATAGVHPHEAGVETLRDAQTLLDIADGHPKVAGFGETGLDYFYDHSPRKAQKRCFRLHIEAAREKQLPIVIHTRAADDDTLEILREEMAAGPFPGVIHCFSSGLRLAEEAIEMGLHISLSGIVTFKKAAELQEIVRRLPLDKLLVETDAPFLAPIPQRGKRNEPAFVVHTAAKAAHLLGVSAEELSRASTATFFRLFTRIPETALGPAEA